jgi:hypothetical protein
MLAPFILDLLFASGLLLLVAWATEALSATMLADRFGRNSSSDKGWHATIPLRTPRLCGDSGTTWTSRLVPMVTTPARRDLGTPAAVRQVPSRPERRRCRDSYA